MFLAVGQLSKDLRRFVAEPGNITLPFSFADDDVGAAIIQIAAGKAPVDMLQQAVVIEPISPDELRSAAQHFVAKVMLDTASDLFTVLGVSFAGEATAYRDNYRRLMAMVHPDARPTGFPTDAAIRVNHAYAVLSDPEQLENYKLQRETRNTQTNVPSMRVGVRSPQASRPDQELGWAGRIGALLFRARERGLLLWLALLLFVPVGSALYLTLSENPQVRLVEARSKFSVSEAGALLAPPLTSALTAPAAPVARAAQSEKASTESTQKPGILRRSPPPSPRLESSVGMTTTPALAFETSLSMSRLATLVQPAAPVSATTSAPPPPPAQDVRSLAPTPSMAVTQLKTAQTNAADVEHSPLSSANPAVATVRAEPQVLDKPLPVTASALPARLMATEARRVTTAVGTPTGHRLRSVDVEDILARFSNAYETGSVSGFDQVLAPGMPGRSQLLTDYGRVFQITRNRSIRFIQLKHTASGDRMATRGYAVVTTTNQENRVSKQRVYLEFEIGIDHNVPRIERISNYVVN